MNLERFETITQAYARLRVAVAGDFCLDQYLEIDPSRAEVSIETGLAVYNVAGVRSQPGGSGTILNNLAALGVGAISPVGFHGEDGEGYQLRRALSFSTGRPHGLFYQDGPRAADVHLLQTAGYGTGPTAARIESAGPEKLDTDTPRLKRAVGRGGGRGR